MIIPKVLETKLQEALKECASLREENERLIKPVTDEVIRGHLLENTQSWFTCSCPMKPAGFRLSTSTRNPSKRM